MIPVPSKEKDILDLAGRLIEQCRVSVSPRMAYYRLMNAIAETGRYDGQKSLINMLYKHIDRMQAHLYSPTMLRFTVDYEHKYPKNFVERGHVVGETLTRQWERTNLDVTFGQGVFEALKYGACLLKQWPEEDWHNQISYQHKLVQPWQFGVYREDENSLDKQEALCETITMTLPEVWRRIYRLPNAEKLFDRIKQHAQQGMAPNEPTSFFHQVLSTSQLNTGIQGNTSPVPGGIVSLGNDPNYPIMSPVIAAPLIQMHELWVKDEDDYTTIQMVEPDILLAPLFKKSNLLIKESRLQPYRLIQPNIVTNWFWGRSELVDLIEPQALLSNICDDFKRLLGLQVDKLLAFIGDTTITDEAYANFRYAGYTNLGQGSDVKDLTPKFPPEVLTAIKMLLDMINMLGGFPEIMQGKGDPGVRAGGHAELLQKMASPQLKDRSLIVERQCAAAGDLTLSLLEAKDAQRYWTKGDTLDDMEKTSFLLSDLPDDWRVAVDSHSSSPVYADEHQQLLFALRKGGDLDGEYMLENLPIPNRDAALIRLREREKQQQELIKQHPELLEKMLAAKQHGKH